MDEHRTRCCARAGAVSDMRRAARPMSVSRPQGRCLLIAYGLVAVGLAWIAATACSGDDKPSRGPDEGLATLLSAFPDTGEPPRAIQMADLEAAARTLPRGQFSADRDLAALTGAGILTLADANFGTPRLLGYDPSILKQICENLALAKVRCSDMRQAAHLDLQQGPPRIFSVAKGTFAVKEITAALKSCEGCPAPRERSYKGVTYFTWSDDGLRIDPSKRLSPPVFDDLGRAGALAVLPSLLMRTLTEDDMKAMIDAQKGGKNLAQDKRFAAVAKALDGAGALTVYLTTTTQDVHDPDPVAVLAGGAQAAAAKQAWSATGPVLKRYELIGLGQGTKATDTFLAVALYSNVVADARENAIRVKARINGLSSVATGQPWSEQFTSVETQVVGQVTLVRLGGPGVHIFAQFLFVRDPLLLHE